MDRDEDDIDHFRKKSIIFRDTRDHHEHDAKNRLLIPGPSSEKPVAEIDQLKKTDLRGQSELRLKLRYKAVDRVSKALI